MVLLGCLPLSQRVWKKCLGGEVLPIMQTTPESIFELFSVDFFLNLFCDYYDLLVKVPVKNWFRYAWFRPETESGVKTPVCYARLRSKMDSGVLGFGCKLDPGLNPARFAMFQSKIYKMYYYSKIGFLMNYYSGQCFTQLDRNLLLLKYIIVNAHTVLVVAEDLQFAI